MKILLSFITILLSLSCVAQTDTLRVFYLRGKAVQISPQKADLKLNMPLHKNCIVELSENASVILINQEGMSITLQKGKNRLLEKINQLNNQNSLINILSRYISSIWERMNEEHKDLDKYAKRHMRNKGLSFRNGCALPLMEMPFYGAFVQPDSITFSWKKDSVQTHTFQIYHEPTEGKAIYSVDVQGESISLTPDFLTPDTEYYWVVFPQNTSNCTSRFKFSIEKNEDQATFDAKMRELSSELKFSEALNALLKAELYEQNFRLAEAQTQYKMALRLEPQNPLFQEMYTLFMARNTVK
jgi:hypothetical protein